MDKIFEITAKEVTIQVKDERTGSEPWCSSFVSPVISFLMSSLESMGMQVSDPVIC